jgi:hypothetical protein
MGNTATVGSEQQPASEEQHLRALEYANRVRLARARVKRRVRAGEVSAAEVILTCPWEVQSMSISDLLMSQRRWGRERCRRLLQKLEVPEKKRIGTLTDRQRLALVSVLSESGSPAPPVIAREHALSAA